MSVMVNVYNAITTDATMIALINKRLTWSGQPTNQNTFQMLTYTTVDVNGKYAFDMKQLLEEDTLQIDIYADTSQLIDLESIHSRLKIIMNGLGFRNIGGAEKFDSTITKVIRATRWVLTNVSDF